MFPPIDIAHITLNAERLCGELARRRADVGDDLGLDPTGPCDELQRALVALEAMGSNASESPTAEADAVTTGADPANLGSLGNLCIDRLAHLSLLAERLSLAQQARQIEMLTLTLACWIARRGGPLTHLAPVVNAAGVLANSTKAPEDLTTLYGLMSEVIDALSPQANRGREPARSPRPWRVLLLNRAIVATRSHRTDLMESAFNAIVETLPGDAPQFFREAMGQMEALSYPPQVRGVVERYARVWCPPRTLH